MSTFAIRGGRVIDPANGIDEAGDVLVDGREIAIVGGACGDGASQVIDATGLVVAPGFIDLHTHLRQPGFEHKETVASGTRAGAAGGFTTLCAMPNTEPPTDSYGAAEYIRTCADVDGVIRVLPIGCITRGRAGKELADFWELGDASCIAFSDDGAPVADANLMRRALEYASMLQMPVINHCEEEALAKNGVMHEGWVSTRLGLRGVPASAEEAMVARDIALAAETGSHLHIPHVSTAGAVETIRRAKAEGVHVTAEVTPHHLTLTHEAVITGPAESYDGLAYDTNSKVNPPLRTERDVEACVAGLLDGTIDCIATDHAPHAIQDKLCEFDHAAFGISGLETALALCLTRIDLPTTIERLTAAPARIFGLDHFAGAIGTLSPGAPADIALIDPDAEWTVEPSDFASKGKNTPFAGRRLTGRVVATIYGGGIAFDGRG